MNVQILTILVVLAYLALFLKHRRIESEMERIADLYQYGAGCLKRYYSNDSKDK